MPIKTENSPSRCFKGCFSGSAGSGKTYSSLLFADTWQTLSQGAIKVGILDTESDSSSIFSDEFDFITAYIEGDNIGDPVNYAREILNLTEAGCNFIIIDSLTTLWDGRGGVIDKATSNANVGKMSPAVWQRAKKGNRDFINSILSKNIHLIATVKTKNSLAFEQITTVNDNGDKITKTVTGITVGKIIQEKDLDYYFDISATLDDLCLDTSINKRLPPDKQSSPRVPKDPNFLLPSTVVESRRCAKQMTTEDYIRTYHLTKARDLNLYFANLSKSRYKGFNQYELIDRYFAIRMYCKYFRIPLPRSTVEAYENYYTIDQVSSLITENSGNFANLSDFEKLCLRVLYK